MAYMSYKHYFVICMLEGKNDEGIKRVPGIYQGFRSSYLYAVDQ